MPAFISRRSLLFVPVAAGLVAFADQAPAQDSASPDKSPGGGPDKPSPDFPRQPSDMVRELVSAAHGNLAKVKSLVEQRPTLALATWDWGFGDWETALGAAAHTGRRAIAEFLLSRGARLDIFAAAMLGQLDAVKAMVAAVPGIQRTLGPHGIPLLAHARAGGDQAKAVVDFLESLGNAGETAVAARVGEHLPVECCGDYTYGDGNADRFTIAPGKDQMLEFNRVGGTARRLFVAGPGELHPAGAPAVRIRFECDRPEGARVTVVDGELTVIGRRRTPA